MAEPISKFINPIDQEPDVAVGIKLPFNKANGVLFDSSYTTEEQAISNLKSLILTRKGERYMQPKMGTDVYNILFDQITEDVLSNMESTLKNDISFWLPYINIDKIEFFQERSHQILIVLKYNVTNNGANRTITLGLTNQGTGTIEGES